MTTKQWEKDGRENAAHLDGVLQLVVGDQADHAILPNHFGNVHLHVLAGHHDLGERERERERE